MADFPFCQECNEEYYSIANRRYHAESFACHNCGPELQLFVGSSLSGDPLALSLSTGSGKDAAAEVLALIDRLALTIEAGEVVAIKGMSGYHLACSALNDEAVARVRRIKLRSNKPFAILFSSIEMVGQWLKLEPGAIELLQSAASPIVLLPERVDLPPELPAPSRHLAPGLCHQGALLPPTPLHQLIAARLDLPLLFTSANRSDAPLIIDDIQFDSEFAGDVAATLRHNLTIAMRCDDSVALLYGGEPLWIRRSRGVAPEPLSLPRRLMGGTVASGETILAFGGDQKSTFTLCSIERGDAIVSHHLGDLDCAESLDAFVDAINHYCRLYQLTPTRIVHDLHPNYHSRHLAERLYPDLPKLAVQHHHAHLVAVAAEPGSQGVSGGWQGSVAGQAALGLALDGTGYGSDGTIWGGELILFDDVDFRRVARLRPMRLIGAERALRQPWRIALALLAETFGDEPDGPFVEADVLNHAHALLEIESIDSDELALVEQILSKRELLDRQPLASSCGRLFDAFATLSGISSQASYEGELALRLEEMAGDIALGSDTPPLPFVVASASEELLFELDWRPAVRVLVESHYSNRLNRLMPATALLSARFHDGLAEGFVEMAIRIARHYQIEELHLAGGCFWNRRLLSKVVAGVEAAAITVKRARHLPPGDGAISFGQAVVARAHLEERESCVWQYR